jgi:hypothetical protein
MVDLGSGAEAPYEHTGDGLRRVGISRRAALTALVALGVLCGLPATVRAATFTVTQNGDSGPGSLRQAISNANSAGGSNTIVFNAPTTIDPVSALPSITSPVLINTVSPQPIVIDGTSTGANANGLLFVSGTAGSAVNGLTVQNFSGGGIFVNGGTVTITSSTFSGNSTAGVELGGGATNSVIGNSAGTGNNFFGNGEGIILDGGTTKNNGVSNNYIGFQANTLTPEPNGGGILIQNGSNNNQIGNNGLNFIGDNTGSGITLTGPGTTGNIIDGNYIGTTTTNFTGPVQFNGGVGIFVGGGAANNQFDNNSIASGPFDPFNLNGLPNDVNSNSFLMNNTLPSFILNPPDSAVFGTGTPTMNGPNQVVPFSISGGVPNQSYFTTLFTVTVLNGNVIANVQSSGFSSVMTDASGKGSDTFSFPPPLGSGTLAVDGSGPNGVVAFPNPFFSSSPPPGGGTTPGGSTTLGNPEVFFDPTTNTFILNAGLTPDSMSFTQGNPNNFTTNFLITTILVGFDSAHGSSISAVLAKHKGKKKVKSKSFTLKSVALTLASGKQQLVEVPLTAKAKAYLKHEVGKTVMVKLTTQESDVAGHSKTYQRTVSVKVLKAKKKTKKKH